MNKIYIVTSGYYSEYHICAVFSNEEDAKKYIKLMNDAGEIEIWEVDKFDLTKFPEGYNYWKVSFNEEGRILSAEIEGMDNIYGDPTYGLIRIWGRRKMEHNIFIANSEYLDVEVCVWAKHEISAIKIATEYRTIMLGSHPELVDEIRNEKFFNDFKIQNGEILLGELDVP